MPSSSRRRLPALALSVVLALLGCGDDDGAVATAPAPTAVAGTAVIFDLDADLSDPEQFYDLPYPANLRMNDRGRTNHSGFPGQLGTRLLRSLVARAGERHLAPLTAAAYFRFDGPIAARIAADVIPAAPDSAVLLINVDGDSRDYARLFPTIASTPPTDKYVPDHFLAVSTPPGLVLPPSSTYAFVILRSLLDADGQALGVPESFAQLRAGEIPVATRGAAAHDSYRALWDALATAGVDRSAVAAATVFSTGDPVAELAELSDTIRERHPVTIENLRVDPDDGAAHERFCEIHGEASLPVFQAGTPPYDRDGSFVFDSDGKPTVQAYDVAPVSITLPRTPMPIGGFPIVMYFHGSSGVFDQVVDRGPVNAPGGPQAKAQGPSYVLSPHGFATFGAAMHLNRDRYTGPLGISGRSYLNISNLGAYADTFRQMATEQRLLLDALADLEISPEIVAACDLEAPADGGFFFETERVYLMGQSLGGQIVNMVGALDPRVVGVAPTGSGGLWSLTVLTADFAPGFPPDALVAQLLGVPVVVDHLHPGLYLVQSGFEPAEPAVFAARLSDDPLPGHEPRAIYQPIAIDDPGFPTGIYNAMALASGTQQAGESLEPTLQDALAASGRDGVVGYAVSQNTTSRDGDPYTGVVVQYESDGFTDGHHIFAQLDDVKYQYSCFLRSLVDGGPGVVPAPAPLSVPCDSQ